MFYLRDKNCFILEIFTLETRFFYYRNFYLSLRLNFFTLEIFNLDMRNVFTLQIFAVEMLDFQQRGSRPPPRQHTLQVCARPQRKIDTWARAKIRIEGKPQRIQGRRERDENTSKQARVTLTILGNGQVNQRRRHIQRTKARPALK